MAKADKAASNTVIEYVVRDGKQGVFSSRDLDVATTKKHELIRQKLAQGCDASTVTMSERTVQYNAENVPVGEDSHHAQGTVTEALLSFGAALLAVLAFFFGDYEGMALAVVGATTQGRGYLELANILTGGAINNNGTTTFGKDFPLGEGWMKMLLRFNNSVTIGTGTGAIAEGELSIIKNVLLKTDRGEILCNLPGRAIYKISAYQSSSPPQKSTVAASTGVYRVTLPIHFADIHMNRPSDTILNTARYNSVSLQVTYGSVSDFYTTVGTSTNVATLDIEVERTLGRLPEPGGLPIAHINYDYRQPVDAFTLTNIEMERSADMIIKRVYVHSGTSGTAGVPFSGANADTVQNIVTIKDQNRFLQKERIHSMIQDGNKIDSGLEAILSGIEVFDFVRDGSMASAVATGNKSVLQYSWTNQGGVAANSIVTLAAEQVRSLK